MSQEIIFCQKRLSLTKVEYFMQQWIKSPLNELFSATKHYFSLQEIMVSYLKLITYILLMISCRSLHYKRSLFLVISEDFEENR